jgi:glycosyltransferase involved in cell wall biosynthesis
MLFSIVIPVHPPHFKYLQNLVNKLLNIKTDDFDYEIIIAASECSNQTKDNLISNFQQSKNFVPDTPSAPSRFVEDKSERSEIFDASTGNVPDTKIRIINTEKRCNAAENRNRVWNDCKGDWIVFTDADDLYHPNRLYIINKLLKKFNQECNLILHNYYFIRERSDMYTSEDLVNSENNEIEEIQLNDELYESTFGCSKEEIHTKNLSEILNRDSIKPRFPLTQGCSAVRKDIDIRFNESLQTGEDPYFCREVLYKIGGVYCLKNKLMIYNFPRIF